MGGSVPHVDPYNETANEVALTWWASLDHWNRQAELEQIDDLEMSVFDYYWHYVAPDRPAPEPLDLPNELGVETMPLVDNMSFGPYAQSFIPVADALNRGGTDVGDGMGGMEEVAFGLPAAVAGISSLMMVLPAKWKTPFLGALAGLGAVRGAVLTKTAIVAAARAVPVVGIALGSFLSLVLADSVLVDFDIPFVPSIGGNGAGPMIGGVGQWATAQHGPVVKEWFANGTPFVMFADGWQAAQRRNGVWKFWKPKKPIVVVPGGPLSRKNTRKLATLYANAKKQAKKDFGLVDSRQGQSRKPVIIRESGPGNINVS